MERSEGWRWGLLAGTGGALVAAAVWMFQTLPETDVSSGPWWLTPAMLTLMGALIAGTLALGKRVFPEEEGGEGRPGLYDIFFVALGLVLCMFVFVVTARVNASRPGAPREVDAWLARYERPFLGKKPAENGVIFAEDKTTWEAAKQRLADKQIALGDRVTLTVHRGWLWDWGTLRKAPGTRPPPLP